MIMEEELELTLSYDGASCNAMADVLQAGVEVEHLSWHRLRFKSATSSPGKAFATANRSMHTCEGTKLTFGWPQHLKKGVIRTKPTL